MATEKKALENTKASPMTYESTTRPNVRNQRAALAMRADGMTKEEIQTEAVALGIDFGSASTKEAMIAVLRGTPEA